MNKIDEKTTLDIIRLWEECKELSYVTNINISTNESGGDYQYKIIDEYGGTQNFTSLHSPYLYLCARVHNHISDKQIKKSANIPDDTLSVVLTWEEYKEIAVKRGYELSANDQGYKLTEKDKIPILFERQDYLINKEYHVYCFSSIYKLCDFLKGMDDE